MSDGRVIRAAADQIHAVQARAAHPREIAGVLTPDSEASRAAEALCRSSSTRTLYAHAVRSYVFAALLAANDGLRVDQEALYVAAVLHDIGLTQPFDRPTEPFERVSAEVASGLVAHHGWPEVRRYELARSIVLHMAAEVSSDETSESQALEAGVSLDVTGRRLDAIEDAVVAAVLQELPRGAFKRDFTALIEREAARKPQSQTASLARIGLLERIGAAPFDDTA